MLINPKHGWVSIVLDDFRAPASYLTDVPIDCIESMTNALKEQIDFCVTFDAEGYCYKIISDYYRTFIIMEKNEPELIAIEKNKFELSKELYKDISDDFESWKSWLYSKEEEPEEYSKYCKKLEEKLLLFENSLK